MKTTILRTAIGLAALALAASAQTPPDGFVRPSSNLTAVIHEQLLARTATPVALQPVALATNEGGLILFGTNVVRNAANGASQVRSVPGG